MVSVWNKLEWKRCIPIILGTMVYAFGLFYFVIPNELMEGGVTGIALLLHYGAGLPPSITTFIVNIPLFVLGYRYLGKASMTYTVVGALSLIISLRVFESLIARGVLHPFAPMDDVLLSALYAGVTTGAGLGIVFRSGGTTGGVDIMARMMQKLRGWRIGQVIFAADAIIISASLLYIPLQKVLYTLIVVFIASKLIDFINDGAYEARAFTIIVESGDVLAKEITQQMDRGVTVFSAKGAYSASNKDVIYCVVSRQESAKLKTLIKSIDPKAFVIVGHVHEVLGEGFKLE